MLSDQPRDRLPAHSKFPPRWWGTVRQRKLSPRLTRVLSNTSRLPSPNMQLGVEHALQRPSTPFATLRFPRSTRSSSTSTQQTLARNLLGTPLAMKTSPGSIMWPEYALTYRHTWRLIVPRTIRSCYGERNASYSLKNLSDLKAGECLLTTNASSAATKAHTVVLTVSQFNFSVEAA